MLWVLLIEEELLYRSNVSNVDLRTVSREKANDNMVSIGEVPGLCSALLLCRRSFVIVKSAIV